MQRTLQVEQVAISSLKPYKKNARTHSKDQVAQIAASMREFGWTNPVLTDEHLEIIAGHGRLEAAKSCGFDTIPVIRLSGLSTTQKKALVLADNKLALNAGWDNDLLHDELSELTDLNFDLNLLGFDDSEIKGILFPTEVTESTGDGTNAEYECTCPQCGHVFKGEMTVKQKRGRRAK